MRKCVIKKALIDYTTVAVARLAEYSDGEIKLLAIEKELCSPRLGGKFYVDRILREEEYKRLCN